MLSRRHLLAGSTALAAVAGVYPGGVIGQTTARNPFDAQSVRRLARSLAEKPMRKYDSSLPPGLGDLNYDQYRMLRFRPDRALWRGEELPFQVQFFHRGFLYSDRVDIFEVVGGEARPLVYSPDLFEFGPLTRPPAEANLGFAGFRLHAPMNTPDYYDEVGVFLGASYFRAVAKGQAYGLSARGLAINTAGSKGEEFPVFRTFWIEKPAKGTGSIVVHALLDSESAAAAFRFTIRPGDTTIFDVEMTVYPRVNISTVGIATMTSMFFFAPNDRAGVDDFRPAVHDSDGLAVRNGRGEEIWRPLFNPRDLQISALADTNPRGFGLLQRDRDFAAYQDLESRFETRPSLWVEPIGNWGPGAIHLVEIPTKEEVHDNIAAFWRPQDLLQAKGEYVYIYRLHWGNSKPATPPLAEFVKTRIGSAPNNARRFVLELEGENLAKIDAAAVRGEVGVDRGQIRNVVTQPNPVTGGWRMAFELVPESETVEMRARLLQGDTPLSEVWVYRWAP
jgi:periplasmic glucans biosynthesis protein